ncbi:MAG TPA: hypothetical protein DC064_01880 [Cyanobacteria bacterium UBA9273]|nr:hypothetical protein [Cyanobacteria bacterium UBA9273]
MKFHKLAIILTLVPVLFACTSQPPPARSEQPKERKTPPMVPLTLKTAIEELRVIKIKIDSGINPKEYREDVTDLVPIVKNAYGDAKVLAAVKSALEGHKLAVGFLECDRINGYDELYQCRDKVLQGVFAKYPDIAAQAQAAVAGENLSNISAGLDKDALLQAIWEKTGTDTEAALQASKP